MDQRIEIEKGTVAVGLATALLDCVIMGPDDADFRITYIIDHPEAEPYFEVRAYTAEGDRAVSITVDADSGNIDERHVHKTVPQ